MSDIVGLFATGLLAVQRLRPAQSQLQQEFKQRGNDLKSGNLSQAQADFAALQTSNPQLTTANAPSGANGVASAFKQLSTDLQSGNLSGAQQDYSSIQSALQRQAGAAGGHHGLGLQALSDASNPQSPLAQALAQLGQALQAGNLSNAKTAYTTLQQDFLQLQTAEASSSSGASAGAVSGALNVSA